MSAEEHEVAWNRKGFTLQNCLVCCDFEMKFTYVLSGWEGSATDATVYHDAHVHELTIPHSKYLANPRFPSCHKLLVLFHGEWYHLAEWGHGQTQWAFFSSLCFIDPWSRPVNHCEYFNLCHSQLHNIVKHIISILKWCFHILNVPPKYNMNIQAWILVACCCIHNIICIYNGTKLVDMEIRAADPANEFDLDVYGLTVLRLTIWTILLFFFVKLIVVCFP